MFTLPEFSFAPSFASTIGALVMDMTYGLNITNNEDQFLRALVEATEIIARVLIPGASLVDIIPMRASHIGYDKNTKPPNLQFIPVKYVPEWFPGAGFKTLARVTREKFDVAINGPLRYLRESMKVSLRNTAHHFQG